MFGSSVLDVVIGLVFLYLLLSLLVTGVNEYIEARMKVRAKNLELGLHELLSDPPATSAPLSEWWLVQLWKRFFGLLSIPPEKMNGHDLVEKLYNHSLINGLFPGAYQCDRRNLPSYIPSRSFALALMDLIQPASAGAENRSGAAGATSDATATTPPPALAKLRENVAACLTAGPNSLLPPRVATAVLALIDAAGNDVVQVRKNLEQWFDSAMDRVSGWYKRRVQWISFVLGLALAIGVNADTFAVADSLARDQALRASVASTAEAYAKARAQQLAPDPNAPKDVRPVKELVQDANEIESYGWPLGWDRDDPRTMPKDNPDGSIRYRAWALKGFGWLVTALAITLGAPFWFDLLNKVIVVRSTVKPTEKSPPEPPVDQ